MEKADDPDRAGGCAEGEHNQDFVIETGKKQFVSDIALADQCGSACNCAMRCCSNYMYYNSYTLSQGGMEYARTPEGQAEPHGYGVVCVDVPNSITVAAEQPSCAFGLANLDVPVQPLP